MIFLPADVKEYVLQFMNGDVEIEDFEKWVYSNKKLEQVLPADDYLELISFEYKNKGARFELFNLLSKYVDAEEYETAMIRRLLTEAQKKNDHFPTILLEFYNLYCKGYDFLQVLGLNYGLEIAAPKATNYQGTWQDLTDDQKQYLLSNFSPTIDAEMEKVLSWIDKKDVVLTGRKRKDNEYYYEYIDHRKK